MVGKNIQIKFHDGVEWINLFPKTLSTLVQLNSGQTIETVITQITSALTEKTTLEDVKGEIEKIVGAAPAALDTLQEISEALNSDPDFAATITNNLSEKVDKVSGKSLSTNDFTTQLKNKLESLQDYSQSISDLENGKASKEETYTKTEVDNRFSNFQANAIPVSKAEPEGASIWFEDLI